MNSRIIKSRILLLIFFLILININPIINGNYEKNQETSLIIPTIKGNIMLTGFWNPTGQMLKPFSTNNFLNPDGWKGENWENFGYNIYSYYPNPGLYNGTFEVDYQNTWNDFWNITSKINPVAIISFGAGNGPWEIEYNARNLDRWIDDEKSPFQPTPCPPDDTVDVGYVRHSTLPVEEIKDAVNNGTNIEAWIDWDRNPGRYLCEYIAYLVMWYQDIHSSLDDQYRCKSAGFIHVRSNIAVDEAMKATNITIIKTIEYLDYLNEPPSSPLINGPTSGKVGQDYAYSIMSIDPEGDEIYYIIDWGVDQEELYGPFSSGENVTINHSWYTIGSYIIKLKSKDIFDSESDWTNLEVSMQKNKSIFTNTIWIHKLIDLYIFLKSQ
jgi:pyrrolidone-carboxylate peptidase